MSEATSNVPLFDARLMDQVAAQGDRILTSLLPMTLATGAILLAAWLADRALERRVTASLRLFLYAAVLARLALPASWQNPLGLLGARSTGSGAIVLGTPEVFSLEAGPAAPAFGPGGWAVLLYAAVVLVLLTRWIHVRLQLGRRLDACRPLPLREGGVPVMRHEELGPFVAGLLRPRIVLPATLLDASDEETLACVLRHEAAHVRRRDPLLSALVQVACILAWPILPVWIAAGRIRTLMEVACDEDAVKSADPAARRRYGEVLLALAVGTPQPRLIPALRFGSPLRGRLRALASWRRWPLPVQGAVVAVVAAVAVACAGAPSPEEEADVDAHAIANPTQAGPGLPIARKTSSGFANPAPGNFMKKGLAEARGTGNPALDVSKPKAPILTMTREGELYLGKLRVTPENLEEEVRKELERLGADTVLLRGDHRVIPARAVDVMLILKRAGAQYLAMLQGNENDAAIMSKISAGRATSPNSETIAGTASRRGSLDPEIVRRVVSQHIGEVKACYERELTDNPRLSGRAAVAFTIAPTGQVVASVLQTSTLGNPRAENCIVQAVRGWEFPKPLGDGIVVVTYPFNFTPSDRAATTPAPGDPQSKSPAAMRELRP